MSKQRRGRDKTRSARGTMLRADPPAAMSGAAPDTPSSRGLISFLRARPRVLGGLLFLLVLAVFLPVLRNDFIDYDDNGYVTESLWVRNGLTWGNIVHAFSTTEVAYWHPLTWISHMTDVQIFGLAPWGHHGTSVLIHAVNALLVFIVLRKMTGAVWRSWIVAALFGLHPLHVESVAWVAERKDVLSTFFFLVTLLSYAEWFARKSARKQRAPLFYALSLLAFSAGLMCKPMLVTLPAVLLLLDFWPLGRWGAGAAVSRPSTILRLVVEKIPFLILSAADSVATVHAQASLGTLHSIGNLSVATRVLNALDAYCAYLGKTFLPTKLAIFYPYDYHPAVTPALLSGLLLAALSIAAILLRKTKPYVLVGWLWFLGTLVPVIGFVQVGAQAMADRYTYVPLLGLFVVVAWGSADLVRSRSRAAGVALGATACAVIIVCATLTVRQIGFWKDTRTLFNHALAVTDGNAAAHFSLGYFYARTGHTSEAIAEYREAVRLAPETPQTHFSLAAMLALAPESAAEAITEFRAALRLDPRFAQAHLGVGQVLSRTPGRTDEAMAEFEQAVHLAPDDFYVHYSFGFFLAALPGRQKDAISHLEAAVRLNPSLQPARAMIARLREGSAP